MSENDMLVSILNTLPMGIMYCSKDHEVLFINKEYAKIIGKEIVDIQGKPVTEVIPNSRVPIVLESGKSEWGDISVVQRENIQNSAVVNRILVCSSEGEPQGVISHTILSKISDLQVLAKKFAKRNALLDKELLCCQERMQAAFRCQYGKENILGNSKVLLEQKKLLECYAKVNSPVLILGETGTGKELFAHSLHASSCRAQAPFVSINCATIPKELFESELFGYVVGAFSGARRNGKVGLVELADGGTLFLDEIGDLPLDAQSKLLRFLETKTFSRVGSVTLRQVDFRLVCATNKDLLEMVDKGQFREDLLYRINSLQIYVPPLRQRKEDIHLLTDYFLDHLGRSDISFSHDSMQIMMSYSWPGNIRMLRNVITHVASICDCTLIEPEYLPGFMKEAILISPRPTSLDALKREEPISASSFADTMARQETQTLIRYLKICDGNVTNMAKKIGVSRSTLYNKFKKLGIDPRQIKLNG